MIAVGEQYFFAKIDIRLIYTSKLTSASSPIEQLLSSVEREQAQNNY
jgi:hypothetical protein